MFCALFSHLHVQRSVSMTVAPPLARYVWCVTWYLRSSCCSETHYAHVKLPVFLPLSTLDVTHVRKCTRPSPLYRTKQRLKAGRGTGNEASANGNVSSKGVIESADCAMNAIIQEMYILMLPSVLPSVLCVVQPYLQTVCNVH